MEYLLRLGELTLKSRRSRKRFMDALIRNISDALESNGVRDYRLVDMYGRIYIDVDVDISNILRRIFGLVGVIEVISHKFTSLEDIASKAIDIYKDLVKDRSFGVKTNRVGRHPFKSVDVNREVGSALLKYASKVDLSNPDVWIKLEVRDDKVYYYLKEYRGYGGLPIGTEGRVLALFSGGYDSPVASWNMLRRGVEVDFIHFQLGGERHFNKVLRVAIELARNWCYGYKPKLFNIDFRPVAKAIRENVRRDYRIVILRRMMYRVASIVAEEINADALVTGESIGQVSSQTLKNLIAIDHATEYTVLRPLIGFDKIEIIDLSREIGLYNYSRVVEEVCALVEDRPVINADPDIISGEEAKLDMSIIMNSVSDRVKYDLRIIKPEQVPMEDEYSVEPGDMPEDALIIDVRGSFSYMLGHIPGSINMSEEDLLKKAGNLARDGKKVIVVCPVGLDSVEIVKKLRELGVEAYYLLGGFRGYLKHRKITESG